MSINISINDPAVVFSDHLSKPKNDRILFSGPFGFGKTYFLKEFFKEHKEYRPFGLSPVKYVVGQNEDIFEYIKVDIAIQLIISVELQRNETKEFSEDLYVHQYLRSNPIEACKLLLDTIKDLEIPVVKQGVTLIEKSLKARENYLKWKEDFKRDTESDFDKLIKFSLSHSTMKGSIYEDDIITQTIRTALQVIKSKNGKSNVLIIDDLDRLDPDHIFRIFNILSIHQSYTEDENKFGFDKIIIVCSIDNIRKIFEHKYGIGVGFDGYIEKFYSTDIFRFNNQQAISNYCQKIFKADLDQDCLVTLGILLSQCVKSEKLSVRSIRKYEGISSIREFHIGPFEFTPSPEEVLDSSKLLDEIVIAKDFVWNSDFKTPIKKGVNKFYISSLDFPILKVIQIMSTIFGDYNLMKDALASVGDTNDLIEKQFIRSIAKALLPLVHVTQNIDKPNNLYCSIQAFKSNEFRNYSNRSLNEVCMPINISMGKLIMINIGWNASNQYNGQESFYSQVNKLFEVSEEVVNEIASTNYSTLRQAFHFINLIMYFLERNNYIRNLGLTK